MGERKMRKKPEEETRGKRDKVMNCEHYLLFVFHPRNSRNPRSGEFS